MARIGFIIDNDFEDAELRVPLDKVTDAGHEAVIIGVEAHKKLEGKRGKETIKTQVAVEDVDAADLDALVIPGGYSPDKLRVNADMVGLVRDIHRAQKPLAAVCHAGSLLVEADIVEGRTVTSWPSIKTDLMNAGARWVDEECVEDAHIITSRKPDDLDAFTAALLRQLAEGPPARADDDVGTALALGIDRPDLSR